MDRRFLEDTALHSPVLFKAILRFNAGQCCPSLPQTLLGNSPSQAEALWRDPHFRRAMVADPQKSGWWSFEREDCRFALLGKDALLALCRRFSASVLGERIAQVIAREQQSELKAKLGPDLYRYAIARGRYQAGSLGRFLLSKLGIGSVAEHFDDLTEATVSLLTAGWPDDLAGMLGLPPKEPGNANAVMDDLTPEQRAAFRFIIKKILLREVAPEWAPCFD